MSKILFSFFFSILLISGCGNKEDIKIIDMTKKVSIKRPESKKSLRIAVSAMISPKETFIYYKSILDYISKKLNIPVELVQRKTYQEINDLLENKDIDCAFVCSGPYVAGKDKFNMELLLAPMVHGETLYYSYVIVHKYSEYSYLDDLSGKVFAFTDPNSNTGCLVPKYEIAMAGKKVDEFFGKIIFSGSHDNSIQAVAQKICDGAAIDHLIWEYLNKNNNEFTKQTKIIEKFGPFAIPPFVVNADLDPLLKEKLKITLLTMHETFEGKEILKNILVDKFVEISDEKYDSVRKMQKWLKSFNK